MSKLIQLLNKTFHPLKIYGLKLWLDASDPATITQNEDGLVSKWSDKSGNDNNATQGVRTRQPSWVDLVQNRKAVLSFDNGDTMVLPSGIYSIPNGSNTTFIVSKNKNDSGFIDYLIHFSEGGLGRYFIQYNDKKNNMRFQSRGADAGGSTPIVITNSTNDAWQIIRGRRDGETQAMTVNGGIETTNSFGADEVGIDAAYIGSRLNTGSFLHGDIAEILMYNRSLLPIEIDKIERYLSNKWAVAI